MKKLDLEQGTPEWLEARKKALNASDAPTIMGDGYNSLDKFLRLRLGIETEEHNDFVLNMFAEGHAAEAAARPVVEQELMLNLKPIVAEREVDGVTYQASFDGLDEELGIVWEHKHTSWDEDWYENVPARYYWQMEHQMLVANTTTALLTVTDRETNEIHSVPYHHKPERREQLIKGWAEYQVKFDDYERTDEAWVAAAQAYKYAKTKADHWKAKADEANTALQELAGDCSSSGSGVTVSVSQTYTKKMTPAAYIKANEIGLPTEQLEKPILSYRTTIAKEKS